VLDDQPNLFTYSELTESKNPNRPTLNLTAVVSLSPTAYSLTVKYIRLAILTD